MMRKTIIKLQLLCLMMVEFDVRLSRIFSCFFGNKCKLIFRRNSIILIDKIKARVYKITLKGIEHQNIYHTQNDLKLMISYESNNYLYFSGPYLGEEIDLVDFFISFGFIIKTLNNNLYIRSGRKPMQSWGFFYHFDEYLDYIDSFINTIPMNNLLSSVVFTIVHGDLKRKNIVSNGKNLYFIDWEFSTIAPILVDLVKGSIDLLRSSSNIIISDISHEIVQQSKYLLSNKIDINPTIIYCNLTAAVVHLIANEFSIGNEAPFLTNYRVLPALMANVQKYLFV